MLSENKEKSLVIFKPDILQRQIVGEIVSRFERKGFKIVAMKMLIPSRELVGKHYEDKEEYLRETGEKAKKGAIARGEDVSKWDSLARGQWIRESNINYLTCGPVIALVLQGFGVIAGVRKMLGSTSPADGDVGTIRADFSLDSFALADEQGRVTRSMVHASDSVESAEREIGLWFNPTEISEYETAAEKIFYDVGWSN
ncbi:MAG: nucleoside-diphosphate kinase [Candidatus Dojkabacteria bacterium]